MSLAQVETPRMTPAKRPAIRFWNLDVPAEQVSTDVLAGITTFLVMSYIIFVNPTILGFVGVKDLAGKGLPFAAVMTSTCLVAALMTILMGLYTNKAYAIAPGMGLNAVIAYQLVVGMGLSWPAAMGVVFLEGVGITILVISGVREAVFQAVPVELKRAIAVGIGWFILFIGLYQAGFVKPGPSGEPLTLGDLTGTPVLVAVIGLALTTFLFVRGFRAAMLVGILGSTAAAIVLNSLAGGHAFGTPGVATLPTQIVSAPDFSLVGKFDPLGIFLKVGPVSAVLVILSILLSDFFDAVGTLLGIGEQAGYVKSDGEFHRVDQPLLIDALSAVAGGAFSSSSATAYIESAAGVGVGGRTGLVGLVVGLLFLLALPFSPIVGVVPKEATAPVMIIVGYLMMSTLGEGINFRDPEIGIPALLTMAGMPLTYSITNGIGAGFLTYTFIRLARGKSVHPLMAVMTLAFLIYFLQAFLHAQFGL